jgi:hypothetical protein
MLGVAVDRRAFLCRAGFGVHRSRPLPATVADTAESPRALPA